MKGSEIIKETLHKADGVLYPVDGRKDKVVIVLSGSEGGLEHAEKLAKYLQIEGCSKGAEYAAAAAIAFHELSCVILKIPSWFYSEGMNGTKPSGTSCWSYKGEEIPYTPYKTRKLPVIKEMIKNREYNILAINTGKKINPDSIIPIEKIQAPILMFSIEVDTIWPSRESCEKLEECARERVITAAFYAGLIGIIIYVALKNNSVILFAVAVLAAVIIAYEFWENYKKIKNK